MASAAAAPHTQRAWPRLRALSVSAENDFAFSCGRLQCCLPRSRVPDLRRVSCLRFARWVEKSATHSAYRHVSRSVNRGKWWGRARDDPIQSCASSWECAPLFIHPFPVSDKDPVLLRHLKTLVYILGRARTRTKATRWCVCLLCV